MQMEDQQEIILMDICGENSMKIILIGLLSLLLFVSCSGVPYKTSELKIIGSRLTSNGDLTYAGQLGSSIVIDQGAGYWGSPLIVPITQSGTACCHILMKDVFLKNIDIQKDQLSCQLCVQLYSPNSEDFLQYYHRYNL